jgi:hypothetical protein
MMHLYSKSHSSQTPPSDMPSAKTPAQNISER